MRQQPIIIFLCLTIILLSGGCAVMALRLMADKQPVNAVNVESNTSYYIERLTANAAWGGCRLKGDVMLQRYDRHGKARGAALPLDSVLQGRKAVLFITRNNCNACAEKEVLAFNTLWKRNGGGDDIVVILNYPAHTVTGLAQTVGPEGFFETDGGDLGTGVGDEAEEPLLFSCQDGHIVSGYLAESSLQPYTHYFHEYLQGYLKP